MLLSMKYSIFFIVIYLRAYLSVFKSKTKKIDYYNTKIHILQFIYFILTVNIIFFSIYIDVHKVTRHHI